MYNGTDQLAGRDNRSGAGGQVKQCQVCTGMDTGQYTHVSAGHTASMCLY